MRDPRLDLFLARDVGLGRVRHNVDHRDPIEADHLFKVDITRAVPVDVLHRKAVVRSVRVGLEDGAPFLVCGRVHGHVEEDRVGAAFKDGVRPVLNAHAGWELTLGKTVSVERYLQSQSPGHLVEL